MSKKVWITLAAVVMTLVIGTAVYAAADESGSFQSMLPFMKQMHPDLSEQQLQEMHSACHGDGSAAGGMMNHGAMHQMMMGTTPPAAGN